MGAGHGGGGPGEDSAPAFFYETDASNQRPGKRVGRGRDGPAVNLRTGGRQPKFGAS